MRIIQREIVAAMIFSKDMNLLMVKKNPSGGGVYIDCWHIPGGGVDNGETQIDALRREIREEVGLETTPNQIELLDNEGKGTSEKKLKDTGEKVKVEMKFNVYKVSLTDKNSNEIGVKLDQELIEYKWFTLNQLQEVKLTPPSEVLFTKLGYLGK